LDERDELALDRLDLRHLSSYAIDNAWSNDPDDAISFDGERIWIHVADPASILSPTSKLDAEAMARGSTLYLPERTIPMLHTSFVQALGLGLAPESKALSFGIRLKEDGRIADTLIVPSMVKVERLTYEQADAMLAGNPILQQLRALADIRAALRRSRGAVDIDFPEVSIKVQGEEPTFLPVPQTLSARIVQECMILAGEAAARWAYERKVPFPFASQDPPTSMNLSSGELGPSRSLAENYSRRRVMKAAIISTTCAAHAGLGLSFYTQVTSPLRRYQDLLAHYQIHAILAKERRSRHFGATADAPVPLDSEIMDARLYVYSQQAAKIARQREIPAHTGHWCTSAGTEIGEAEASCSMLLPKMDRFSFRNSATRCRCASLGEQGPTRRSCSRCAASQFLNCPQASILCPITINWQQACPSFGHDLSLTKE